MTKYLKKISGTLLPVLMLGLVTVACKKEVDSLDPMRMFTPAGAIQSVSGETQVKLTWNPSLYTTASSGVTYTVEVAADTLFATPVLLTVQTDTSGVVFTDDQLDARVDYYARIWANTLGERPESKPVVSNRFRIRGEQIFETMFDSDVIENAVILKWRESPGLTRIVLTPTAPAGNPIEVPLTEAHVQARQILIEGLRPSTAYTAEIFRNNSSKGTRNFTTKAASFAGEVIDLTGITNRPSVLQDTLPQIPSGSTVLLKRGTRYTISSTVNLDRSVTIMSANSFNPELAEIYFTSNFNFTEGSQIDSVVFKSVAMRSDNYSSRYVLNANKAFAVGKIKFEACHTEIFRGLVRLQSAGTVVDKFQILNSVVDSLSNYGVLTIDNAGADVKDIVFKNSTFYKIERFMTSKAPSRSILIENSTFSEVPEGGRYLIDYTTSNDVTGGIKVNNSIFGIGKSAGGNRAVSGIRAGNSTLIESGSTHVTSDLEVTSNEIPGVSTYSGTTFDLFKDPRNGDFTLIDNNFQGRNNAGDPRWR
ncbi:DUF5123 domain-containing protein [Pontibacter sp. HSC-14F20]|uniref:DUF5123 domain-containing protein n=1 Tax=Pontibacter sp. HSC-14F20 TaxID=2864136 RepID=UPI001C7310D8|nr:DUF5123 domain-containing protein [Pontibacter sp. HSC-14F20]MBX0332635.1 DUF5123 domain-containing protein [Pontibacter sp. HSC-14F20]